ncbi:MAG: beta-lactamase family protein [Bacteroidota bacterium]|nr:beta-lactamase family protein [Bacteroidota bacterium]
MAYDTTVLYSKGYSYADELNTVPVTTQSLFRIASCMSVILCRV